MMIIFTFIAFSKFEVTFKYFCLQAFLKNVVANVKIYVVIIKNKK